jgi:hypothetical protein
LPNALRPNPNGNCGSPAVPPPGWPAPTMRRWPEACSLRRFCLAR